MGAEQSTGHHKGKACRDSRYRGAKRGREHASSSDALHETLELLAVNDYNDLSRARPRFVKGSLTWARLATSASAAIAHQLLSVRSDQALEEAVENVRELMHRMETREGVPGARITKEIREQITLLFKVAATLSDLQGIAAGRKPTEDAAGRTTALRMLWNRLGGDDNPLVSDLITEAVAKVLASSAPSYVKSLFNRSLTHWLPSPPAGSASPSSQGTKVSFDSDDDF